jgi:capsid protein
MNLLRPQSTPQGAYDLTTQRKARRQSTVEFTEERGKCGMLNDHQALMTTADARNLYRNYCQAKSMVNQLLMNVVGCGNRVIFDTGNEQWDEEANHWFENEWGASCDGRDYSHIHDLNKLILASIIREHDCVIWFDRGGLIDQGKIFYWETDQIVGISDADFDSFRNTIKRRIGWTGRADQLRQESGIVYAARSGKALGYLVSSTRGQTVAKWKEVTVLPHGSAQMIKNKWRLIQGRGIADILTCATNLIDNYEMLSAELQAAKTAAKFAIKIKTADSHSVAKARADSSNGQATDASIEDDDAPAFTNYKNFEKLASGAIEYLETDEDAEVMENKRPAPHMQEFISENSIASGGSMGLTRVYSLMQANASFSAVKGEMNIAGVTFKCWQKFLERYVLKWEVEEAIPYAVATGQLLQAPANWRRSYEFDHPIQKSLDEDKQTRSDERALRTLQKTYKDIHGPDWKKKLTQSAKDRKFKKELEAEHGIIFETENMTQQPVQVEEVIAS